MTMILLERRLVLFFLVCTICVFMGSHVMGLKCYVCTDCENYYNDTHLIECDKTEERCLTMVLANEEVERACGSKDACTRIAPPTPKPSKVKKREEFGNSPSKKRTVRQLLQQQEKEKDETKPAPEFTSMHCCMEDECNSAFTTRKVKVPTLIFSVLLLKNQLQQNTFPLLLISAFVYFYL